MFRSRVCHTAGSLPAFGRAHGSSEMYGTMPLRPRTLAGRLVWAAAPPPVQLGGRRLRCSARLTSSRDSLDDDACQQQLSQPGSTATQQRRLEEPASPLPSAVARRRDAAPSLAAAANGLQQGTTAAPRELSVSELQRLTQLHSVDAYNCGVVASPEDLAACLGTDLARGLCESEASWPSSHSAAGHSPHLTSCLPRLPFRCSLPTAGRVLRAAC